MTSDKQWELDVPIMPTHERASVDWLAAAYTMKSQLVRRFGEPPGSAFFTVITSGHNVALKLCFDPEDCDESRYAERVENGQPKYWDNESLARLGLRVRYSE